MTTPTIWSVHPAKKTQISLGIRPVWSESSLCTQWVAKDPRSLHAYSKGSDQTGQMPRLIWVLAGHTGYFVGFVMLQLTYKNPSLLSAICMYHHQIVLDCLSMLLPFIICKYCKIICLILICSQFFLAFVSFRRSSVTSAELCHDKTCLLKYNWATSWENLIMPYANNKGADQSARIVHQQSDHHLCC